MSGLLSLFLTLTLSELASAYPVAGAMASWAWKCARGGVGGERKWGWLLGGIVLAGHAAAVSTLSSHRTALTVRSYWSHGRSVTSSRVQWLWLLIMCPGHGIQSCSFWYVNPIWGCECADEKAILLFLGCVGTTATGRSHKFWICGGELSVRPLRAALML